MEKKYILSLILLISASSVFAMKPSKPKPGKEKKEKKDKKKDTSKRAAFLAALADGTLSVEGSDETHCHLCFPGLKDDRQFVELRSLDSFSMAAVKSLRKMTTKDQPEKTFRGISDEQRYSIFAAYKYFVSYEDLQAIGDQRFEGDRLPIFKDRPADKLKNEIIIRRQALLRAMELKLTSNIKVLLGQPMQPWTEPLHRLILEQLESGETKKAE